MYKRCYSAIGTICKGELFGRGGLRVKGCDKDRERQADCEGEKG